MQGCTWVYICVSIRESAEHVGVCCMCICVCVCVSLHVHAGELALVGRRYVPVESPMGAAPISAAACMSVFLPAASIPPTPAPCSSPFPLMPNTKAAKFTLLLQRHIDADVRGLTKRDAVTR
jgi:hypothetical protein